MSKSKAPKFPGFFEAGLSEGLGCGNDGIFSLFFPFPAGKCGTCGPGYPSPLEAMKGKRWDSIPKSWNGTGIRGDLRGEKMDKKV